MNMENWMRLIIFFRFMKFNGLDLQNKPDMTFYNDFYLILKD